METHAGTELRSRYKSLCEGGEIFDLHWVDGAYANVLDPLVQGMVELQGNTLILDGASYVEALTWAALALNPRIKNSRAQAIAQQFVQAGPYLNDAPGPLNLKQLYAARAYTLGVLQGVCNILSMEYGGRIYAPQPDLVEPNACWTE